MSLLALERTALRWTRRLALVGGGLLLGVALVTVVDALLRSFLGRPLQGTFEATERNLLRRIPGALPGMPPHDVAATISAVKRYFAGEEIDFSGVTLDLADQGEFFKKIYAAARRVGWGRTTTYGTLAKELGAGPEAARDVGQAMAKNPVPLIIPCHRVLAAGGKVGGFSAPGGAATKVRMLKLEGVDLEPPPPRRGGAEGAGRGARGLTDSVDLPRSRSGSSSGRAARLVPLEGTTPAE